MDCTMFYSNYCTFTHLEWSIKIVAAALTLSTLSRTLNQLECDESLEVVPYFRDDTRAISACADCLQRQRLDSF